MRGQTDNALRSMGKWGNQLQWTGRQLQYNWTLPVAAAGAAAFKFAQDQERAMTRVRKVYGDMSMPFKTSELEALEKAFVALSNRYGVTIEETTNIAAEWAAAGSSGLALAKNVEQTMRTMVLGELSATEATTALVAIQAQYGFTSDQLADTLARLNAIENATTAKTSDLIIAFSRTAGVARDAGVSTRELGAMVAALVPAAGTAAQAGNALKTIIGRLMSPTRPAAQIMEEMGLNISEVGWQSMTATQRLDALSKAYDGLTDSQKNVASATIASLHQTNKAVVLFEAMQNPASYYHTAMRVAADDANYFAVAEHELNTVLESSPQKMKQVGVILQNSMVKVIQPLLPYIIGLAQQIARAAEAFGNLDPEVRKLIITGLIFLALLGPIARYVGSMATLLSILGRSFTALRVPVLLSALTFGLWGKKSVEQVDDAGKKVDKSAKATVAKMRLQFLKGFPGMVGMWRLFKHRVFMQMVGLQVGVNKILMAMRARMAFIWAVTLLTMQNKILYPALFGMVNMFRATLVPGFLASMTNLRIALWARWAVTWSYMMAPLTTAWAAMVARTAAGVLAIRTWMTLGGTMSIWTAAWIRLQLIVGLAMVGMKGRVIAGMASIRTWMTAMWAATQLRMAAITAAGNARMVAIMGPFRAAWAAAWVMVIRVQMAASSAMAMIARVFQRGVLMSFIRFGALLPQIMAATGAAMSRAWYATLLFINRMGLIFGRLWAATMAGVGTFVSVVWRAAIWPFTTITRAVMAATTAIWAGGTFLMRTIWLNFAVGMKLLARATGMAVGAAWGAATAWMSRVWGMVLMFMRIQWLAFITFLKSPAMILAAFKGMGKAMLAGGRGLMAILAVIRTGFIAMLTSPWGLIILAVVAFFVLFRDQIAKVWQNIKDYFSNANNDIAKSFDALPNGIKGAFLKVIAFVKAAAMKIREWLSYLNPFQRHSPSLVDNVRAGMAVIRAQYGTLTQIAGPVNQAYKYIKQLNQASASFRQGAASVKLAEQIKEIAEVAPGLVGPFRVLANHLTVLEQKAEALDTAVKDQEQTTNVWKQALDDANDVLQAHEDHLTKLTDVADGYRDQITELEQAITDLAQTPITGMGVMENQIWANEMAQKRLRYEIMAMEDAGQTYEDVQSKIAAMNGEIEALQGTQNDLRSAGAGSEILSFYDDQIKAIEDQKKAMDQQSTPIRQATEEIERLAREAERLDLEKSLKFDPLTRQIEKASSTMQEMPFDQILGQINQNKAALGPLEAAWEQANRAVENQQHVVNAAKAAHDQIQAGYDIEQQKLDVLKNAYSEVSSAIQDVNQSLNDMTSAASKAREAGESVSPALQNFRDAAAGGDFPDVGGTANLGREDVEGYGLGDQTGAIEQFTADMEAELGNAFGGMDMFGPIKDWWNKFVGWWDATVVPFFVGSDVGGFLTEIFEGVDFLQPIRDVWDDIGAIFTGTDWGAIFDDVWAAITNWIENIWDFAEIFMEILGPDVMKTFEIVRDAIVGAWDRISKAFTSGGVADAIDTLVSAFNGFWNFVFPILQFFWAIFLMVVQVIWSAVNGVLAPVLEWIVNMFFNIWDIIVGFWNVVSGIFTGDWDKVWKGVKQIFSGVWGAIWDTLVGIGKAILGFIWGIMTGIWDNIVWVWNKVLSVLGWIVDKFSWMGSLVGAIFRGLGAALVWVWDHSIGWLFSKVWDFLQMMPGWWQTAVDAIGRAWDWIKEKARGPIQWVIDIVWNNGLRKLWNVINNLWGGDDIDPFRMAKGGVVGQGKDKGALPGYTPGRDVHKFYSPTGGRLDLSGGEAVLRPEFTKAVGREGVDTLNQIARTRGAKGIQEYLAAEPYQAFANGGVISLPGWIDDILDWIPGTGAITDAIDLINGNQGGSGPGDLGRGMLKIPAEVGGKIWDAVSAWWEDDEPKSSGGVRGTGGGSQVDKMYRAIKQAFPRAKLNSGQRNTNDMHGRGKAIDLGEEGFSGGQGRRYMAEMEKWIRKNVANVSELIYNGLYDNTPNMKNGRNHPYNAETQAAHKNHLHWGQNVFDDGGVWGVNNSGRPERVLSPRQTLAFERLVALLDNTGLPSVEALEGAIFRATQRAHAAETIGGQTIVNGDYGTTNITVNFYGDLEFPNITSGDDADVFLQNLGDMAGGRV